MTIGPTQFDFTRNDLYSVGKGVLPSKATAITKALGGGGASEFHKKSVFFPPIDIQPDRWNRLFPYRLIIVKPNTLTGAYDPINFNPTGWSGNIGGDRDQAEYVLPITPNDLQIIDPYAISVSATLRGIIEEHNGLKFKLIRASGTVGIWPSRKEAEPITIPLTIVGGGAFGAGLNSLTAGSREALGGLIESGKELFGFDKGKARDSAPDRTGYEMMLEFQQFLEAYVEAKKDPANNSWRLAFDNAKNNETLLVTPILLNHRKTAASPMESTYNFELKAWKRIVINGAIGVDDGLTALRGGKDGNFWQTTLDKLSQARRTISKARNIIAAVRNDINGPLNAMRQVVLAVKDISGTVTALIDLPDQVINDYKKFFAESKQQLRRIFEGSGQLSDVSSSFSKLDSALSVKKERAAVAGSNTINTESTTSAENVFDDPTANFDFWDSITTDAIPVSTEISEAIQAEIDQATSLTNDDIQEIKQELLGVALDLADSFGAGNSTFATINNRSQPVERARPMSVDEFDILKAFFDFTQALDSMTSTGAFEESLPTTNPEDTDKIAFVSDLAVTNDIIFNSPISKILIPLPFGATLEQIAHTFLGDADRWNEIVVLNNLRAPYIDEEGSTQTFLSNGGGRQFNISDGSTLWIGQKIELFSDIVPLFFRKIISVEEIGLDNWLITVDGNADLEKMTTVNNASIRHFLPGTVNSQDKIFLPSSLAPPENSDLKIATFQDSDSALLAISKVDILLTPDNDIALNNQGDVRIANGLTNLIQAMKLKVITEKNTLFKHPTFGLGIFPGVSINDISGQDMFKDMNSMIKTDSRFSDIERMSVNIRNGAAFIDLAISLTNDSGILPLSFPLGVR